MLARRWNAASSYWCPRHAVITGTCWLARYRHHPRRLRSYGWLPVLMLCKMSSGTSTDEIHTFSPRELCLCGVLSWCIRHSVRLSVCHKLVLGSVSKLLNVRSRKERCIVAQLRNLVFGDKDLDEIQTRCRWVFCSVLFISRFRSEGWPHHGSTFSIYPCPLSFWFTLPTGSPVHVLMLSTQAVRGLPRLRAPGIVPCIISFSRLWWCLTVSSLLQLAVE